MGRFRRALHRSQALRLASAALAAAFILVGGLSFQTFGGASQTPALPPAPAAGPAPVSAHFVGSQTCTGCHPAEAARWRESQHRQAMDHANEHSVLGNFSNASFDYYGVHSRFFRRDGRYYVETDGPDGKLAEFEIKYTFGVYPLQQYLIEFPDGRVQALSLAWDSRPAAQSGQRWFHLYPDENIRHDDILHWTKLNQNWNFMCAECHSTGLRKNYDARSDRFATSWAEISVGCEACHGEGSQHVDWARSGRGGAPDKGLLVLFNERHNASWSLDANGRPQRSARPQPLRKEVETCGRCHARRPQFSEDWTPGRWLSETHMVLPLNRGLYYADGQMLDEVYNYGSFKQSKMFAAGVTCSDCHEAHSSALRLSGDGACLQCHPADKFAAFSHHRHETSVPAPSCVECHMPARTYMVVDKRHDHSFRVPRPDLSAKLGIPNACNDCHKNKPAQWATQAIEGWFGPQRKGFQTYAEAFHAAASGQAGAGQQLAAVAADPNAPGIARATALSELNGRIAALNDQLIKANLADPDPMVRIGALDLLDGAPAGQLWTLAAPLLADPVKGVRIRAASLLAVPDGRVPPIERKQFDNAAIEFIAAQRFNADRPEARSALGLFYARRAQPLEAEAEYRAALRLSPQYAPAAVNLADLHRQTGRDGQAESVLRAAAGAAPNDAGVHNALGLALVRLKRLAEALTELQRAAELDPGQPWYAYVYGVALHSAGRAAEAMAVLKQGLARRPDDRNMLLALASYSREAGDLGGALYYAERLARAAPGDREAAALVDALKRESNGAIR